MEQATARRAVRSSGDFGDENRPVTIVYPDRFLGWDEVELLVRVAGVRNFSSTFTRATSGCTSFLSMARGRSFQSDPGLLVGPKLSPEERSLWAGDAGVVADVWKGVDAPSIEKYLATWDLDDDETGQGIRI